VLCELRAKFDTRGDLLWSVSAGYPPGGVSVNLTALGDVVTSSVQGDSLVVHGQVDANDAWQVEVSFPWPGDTSMRNGSWPVQREGSGLLMKGSWEIVSGERGKAGLIELAADGTECKVTIVNGSSTLIPIESAPGGAAFAVDSDDLRIIKVQL
jgi:hypothetical protein